MFISHFCCLLLIFKSSHLLSCLATVFQEHRCQWAIFEKAAPSPKLAILVLAEKPEKVIYSMQFFNICL